ncbi:MAG: hypothetical protein RBU37_09850 [Myxococcota bacterium]|nr:hypothetical protein [Myxococcota bacterium]
MRSTAKIEVVRDGSDVACRFSASTSSEFSKLCQDAEKLGGLMLPPEPSLQLNEMLALCLAFQGDERWFSGRVVHNGPRGVALELRPANNDAAGRWSAFFATPQKQTQPLSDDDDIGLLDNPFQPPLSIPAASLAPSHARERTAPTPPPRSLSPSAPAHPAQQHFQAEHTAQGVRAIQQHQNQAVARPARPTLTVQRPVTSPLSFGEEREAYVELRPPPAEPATKQTMLGIPRFDPEQLQRGPSGAWEMWRSEGLGAHLELAEELHQKDLDARQVPALLLTISGLRRDTILELRFDQHVYHFGLQAGLAVLAEHTQGANTETLGDFLLAQRKIDAATHQAALAQSQCNGCTYEKALVRSGKFGYDELLAAVRLRIGKAISAVIGMSAGRARWAFVDDLPVSLPVPPIALPKFVHGLVLDNFSQNTSALISFWQQNAKRLVKLKPSPPISIDKLGLNELESSVIASLSKTAITAAQLQSRLRSTQNQTAALLATLETLDIVLFEQIAATDRETAMVGRLRERIELLLGGDHFTALGLHWSAYQEDVEQAYNKQKLAYVPSQFPEGVRQSLATLLERLSQRFEEAYEVLKDRTERSRYRREIINPAQIQMGVNLYIDQTEWAIVRADRATIDDGLKRIIELEPGNQKARELRDKARGR